MPRGGVSSQTFVLRRGTSPQEHPARVHPTSFQAKNTWKTPQAVARTSRGGREQEAARSPARQPTPASNSCAQHSCGAAWEQHGGLEGEAEPCSHPWPDLTASSPLQLDLGCFVGIQDYRVRAGPGSFALPACDKSLETRNLAVFQEVGRESEWQTERRVLEASAVKSVKP